MQRLAQELGSGALVACVSGDHGFAPALRYAAGRGCTTVAVTAPPQARRRPAWAPPPDYARFPLPAAAERCLVWDESWLPGPRQAAEEAAAAARVAGAAGLAPPPLPARGGVVAAWRAGRGHWSLDA